MVDHLVFFAVREEASEEEVEDLVYPRFER